MKLDIYKTNTPGEYSWRLKHRNGNEVARMPDGTAAPSKIKRTVRALQGYSGIGSGIWRACDVALTAFEKLHPTPRRKMADASLTA